MCRYAAKLPGEGADMYDAAEALRDAMLALGLACDGGKDSVSMVARAGDEVGCHSWHCRGPCLRARQLQRVS